ncbi:hypothetical protein AB0N73_01400 [Microbacterium sp. NPDC089189]|uniref:hypothetical protein n=1 Tax=Microbacterium sp. NPDC089189 TaxID=3154972 RepID=UPI0034228327
MTDPSVARRATSAAVILAAALAAAACASGTDPGARTVGDSAAPAPHPAAGIEVDEAAPVQLAGGIVTTPCFVYRVPDPSWTLVPGSAGCASTVTFGADILTEVRVTAVTSSGTLAELGAELADGTAPGGAPPTAELVTIGGREAARVVAPFGEGTGLEYVSYVVPYPDSGVLGRGETVGAVVVTTMWSPDYEGFASDIIGTLTRPDGSPL